MTEDEAKAAIDAAVKNTVKPMKGSDVSSVSPNVKQLAELATRSSRSMIAIVDAMAQRGAVKGEEMYAVGQLREQATEVIKLGEAVASEIASAENEAKNSGKK